MSEDPLLRSIRTVQRTLPTDMIQQAVIRRVLSEAYREIVKLRRLLDDGDEAPYTGPPIEELLSNIEPTQTPFLVSRAVKPGTNGQ